MVKVCAGAMRERITFQIEAKVADGGGGFTETWGAIATNSTVWAQITPVKGAEKVDAGALTGMQTYLIRIRYRTDITTANRVLWGALTLNIRTPLQNRDEVKKYMWFEAVSGVTQ